MLLCYSNRDSFDKPKKSHSIAIFREAMNRPKPGTVATVIVLSLIAMMNQSVLAAVAPAAVHNIHNNEMLENVPVGQQVVLRTHLSNGKDLPQSYLIVLEVRDSNAITVYLAWQNVTVAPNSTYEMGASWAPDGIGKYTVRALGIPNPQEPGIVDNFAFSEITVVERH
jgi:hypothetical protein